MREGDEWREAARMEDVCLRDSPLWVGGVSSRPPPLSCSFPAAGGVTTDRTGEAAGKRQQLQQPPLAEVRCLPPASPARVSASLAAAARPLPLLRPASCPSASGSGPDRR